MLIPKSDAKVEVFGESITEQVAPLFIEKKVVFLQPFFNLQKYENDDVWYYESAETNRRMALLFSDFPKV